MHAFCKGMSRRDVLEINEENSLHRQLQFRFGDVTMIRESVKKYTRNKFN
jgi:hypothetical protein